MDYLSGFFTIEPQTGKVLHKKSYQPIFMLHPPHSSPTQEIIFGTADRGVFALDKSTLFNKW